MRFLLGPLDVRVFSPDFSRESSFESPGDFPRDFYIWFPYESDSIYDTFIECQLKCLLKKYYNGLM